MNSKALRRLDVVLVERGLSPSRARGREWIESGKVRVSGVIQKKPAFLVEPDEEVELEVTGEHWVSRGAHKLLAALDHFGVIPAGRIAFDIGASTGGFTQVLLTRGARQVIAVDVGSGQLDAKLRADPRVLSREHYHARHFNPADFPGKASILVMDVSFISIRLVLPAVLEGLDSGADLLVLFKPQFEVGREGLGSGGIVRDPEVRQAAVDAVIRWSKDLPLEFRGVMGSPIPGGDGNLEFLIHWVKA
jgi:23S rRNA (cytidine1920-2'-O)/16S rRNA (cytidine1409-2'-O)-methyltransferase